ncbi:hypothetical protein HK101_002547, partial [Irineochytrium annulatum]
MPPPRTLAAAVAAASIALSKISSPIVGVVDGSTGIAASTPAAVTPVPLATTTAAALPGASTANAGNRDIDSIFASILPALVNPTSTPSPVLLAPTPSLYATADINNSTAPLNTLVSNSPINSPPPPVEIPVWQRATGVGLALLSGCLIGSSVVFTKKGLLMTRSNEAGREHKYLTSPMWWIGMVLMGLGEVANFGAYAFVPAILVTPLGALSVVISAVLSSLFLKEYLSTSGKIGCIQCIIGAVIIVLHAPAEASTETIPEFFYYVISPGFLTYSGIVGIAMAVLIFYVAPRHGTRTPFVYIAISSLGGAYLVLAAQGFGSSVVYTFRNPHDNQFLHWPIYPLFAFIIFAVFAMIHFLNRALSIFSTAIVTPIYYVSFTTSTLVASSILFRGFPVDSATAGLSIVMGFIVIVGGVALLFQYSIECDAADKKKAADEAAAAGAKEDEGKSEGAGTVAIVTTTTTRSGSNNTLGGRVLSNGSARPVSSQPLITGAAALAALDEEASIGDRSSTVKVELAPAAPTTTRTSPKSPLLASAGLILNARSHSFGGSTRSSNTIGSDDGAATTVALDGTIGRSRSERGVVAGIPRLIGGGVVAAATGG